MALLEGRQVWAIDDVILGLDRRLGAVERRRGGARVAVLGELVGWSVVEWWGGGGGGMVAQWGGRGMVNK